MSYTCATTSNAEQLCFQDRYQRVQLVVMLTLLLRIKEVTVKDVAVRSLKLSRSTVVILTIGNY